MTDVLSRVRGGPIVVADGAWGTMLQRYGLPPGQAPETWTLERPEVIAAIAREYLDAGAEILTTNTFGGSPARLGQHRLGDRLAEINRNGVEVLKAAAEGRAWISASVGPTGLMLKPLGAADPGEVAAGYESQITVLAAAGADVICVETMTDLGEASLAVKAARAVAPALPVMATMTFDITPRGPFTMMGVSVERAVKSLEQEGADIVGANCGTGVAAMLEVAREFARHTQRPIAVRPNAGLPEREGSEIVYRESPEAFAAALREFAALGVAIAGGCCGTTPAHIAAMSAARGPVA